MQGIYSDRLIVSDLDGTFLGEKDAIVARNIEALREFQSKGGRFTFATGRTYKTLCELVPLLPQIVNAPLILLNGTILYDHKSDQLLREYKLSIATLLPIVMSFLRDVPDLRIRFLKGNDAYEYCAENHQVIASLSYCNKIVLIGDPDKLVKIQLHLKAMYPSLMHVCKSTKHLLELLPFGASKGVLLDEMRALLTKNRPIRVYGIGDYENDLELLKHADVAACPQNAIDAVKRVSIRHVCHHTSGAIADLIQTIYKET